MIDRRQFRRAPNYYLALGSEVLRPLLHASARLLASGRMTEPARWRRGLLLGATHIGDVLYRTASLGALKAGLPECAWHYLTEPGSAPVLETNPHLAGVIEGDLPRAGSSAFFALAHELRSHRFDVAICYGTGSYWPELLLAVQAGIPNRVGYIHKGFSGLVTHPIDLRAPQPFPAYFRDLVATLTGQAPTWPLRPVVETTAADDAEAEALWRELAFDQSSSVLACFVTTRQPSGIWPRASYLEVVRRLAERHRLQIVLCGAPGDAAVLAELKREHGLDCQIAAGRLGLRALVAFLRRCTAVLSTDSGPRHLANAAGVPVFFVRNLWFSKAEAGAYCETDIDLAADAEWLSPEEQSSVLAQTTVENVVDAIRARLRLSEGPRP